MLTTSSNICKVSPPIFTSVNDDSLHFAGIQDSIYPSSFIFNGRVDILRRITSIYGISHETGEKMQPLNSSFCDPGFESVGVVHFMKPAKEILVLFSGEDQYQTVLTLSNNNATTQSRHSHLTWPPSASLPTIVTMAADDESVYLFPSFIRHYSRLGFKRFIVYINANSFRISDGYFEFLVDKLLLQYPDIEIYLLLWPLPYWYTLDLSICSPYIHPIYKSQGFQHLAQPAGINHALYALKYSDSPVLFIDFDEYIEYPAALHDGLDFVTRLTSMMYSNNFDTAYFLNCFSRLTPSIRAYQTIITNVSHYIDEGLIERSPKISSIGDRSKIMVLPRTHKRIYIHHAESSAPKITCGPFLHICNLSYNYRPSLFDS